MIPSKAFVTNSIASCECLLCASSRLPSRTLQACPISLVAVCFLPVRVCADHSGEGEKDGPTEEANTITPCFGK